MPIDPNWSRRRLDRARDRLDKISSVADATTRFFTAVQAMEAARQGAEAQFERRRLLPLAIDAEETTLRATVVRAQMDLDALRHERAARIADYARQAALAPLQWERLRLTLQAEIAEAEDAERRRQLQAQAQELDFLRQEIERLALEAELDKRREAMRPPNGPADTTPEAFKRHYGMAQEVRRNHSEADRRIEEIYLKAAAERRQLTDEEIQEVDALADAADGAEAELRRGAASDLK